MKAAAHIFVWTMILSLTLWYLNYTVVTPGEPLSRDENFFLVLASAVVVLGARKLHARLTASRKPTSDPLPQLVPLVLLSGLAGPGLAVGGPPPDGAAGALDGDAVLACSAEKVTARAGETLELRAWTYEPPAPAARYRWTVTGGTVEPGEGGAARWSLADLQPGNYRAVVELAEAGPAAPPRRACQVVLTIPVEATRGPEGLAFLERGGVEAPGYGLYTYLLLGSRPATPAQEERVRRILAAYLALDDLRVLEQYLERRELNVVYLPVTALAAPDGSRDPAPPASTVEAGQALARWALGRYDYERASVLLHQLRQAEDRLRDPNGLYLVSSLLPLGSPGLRAEQLRVHDLTAVSPDYAWAYVRHYLRMTTQQTGWDVATLRRLALDVRAMGADLARGFKELRGQWKDVVELIGLVSGN